MLDVIYRTLRYDEVDALRTLRLEALQIEPTAFVDLYEEEVAKSRAYYEHLLKHDVIIGAYVDTTLVGMSILSPMRAKKQAHKAIMWFTYVTPSMRGHGMARHIHLKMMEIARTLKLSHLICGVVSTNTAILNLHKSQGCVEMSTERNALQHEGVYYDVIHLINYLDAISDTQ